MATEERGVALSWYRQQLESFLSELDINGKVIFDIGGREKPIKGRTKSWDIQEQNYHILDIGYEDVDANWNLEDDWSIDPRANYEGAADTIFCLETFEYLLNDLQAIKNIAFVLKDTGKAYISFSFSYPHHNQLEMDTRRYTESGIKRLAGSAGLKITNTWYRKDRSGLLKQFYAADGMRAAKEYHDHSITGFIVEMTRV